LPGFLCWNFPVERQTFLFVFKLFSKKVIQLSTSVVSSMKIKKQKERLPYEIKKELFCHPIKYDTYDPCRWNSFCP
jgi:hypothetical protein